MVTWTEKSRTLCEPEERGTEGGLKFFFLNKASSCETYKTL
jgi:hypothetical protein